MKKGFSLLEAVVMLGVFSVLGLFLAQMFSYGMRMNQKGDSYALAGDALNRALELVGSDLMATDNLSATSPEQCEPTGPLNEDVFTTPCGKSHPYTSQDIKIWHWEHIASPNPNPTPGKTSSAECHVIRYVITSDGKLQRFRYPGSDDSNPPTPVTILTNVLPAPDSFFTCGGGEVKLNLKIQQNIMLTGSPQLKTFSGETLVRRRMGTQAQSPPPLAITPGSTPSPTNTPRPHPFCVVNCTW